MSNVNLLINEIKIPDTHDTGSFHVEDYIL